MQHISLSHLNALVAEAISHNMEEAYWIVAEVSELRTAANGHCYMELVEKDEHGRGLLARASAHVWKSIWPLIKSDFETQTGEPLSAGMKILVEAEPTFHELYGYSLNITDIDPTYTLGDIARNRAEILKRLEDEGVLTLNKELALPRPVTRIAVVSSETAAGYGDFLRQLESSPFRFHVSLFPAVMQGDGVEESIIAALDEIASRADAYDCVCILRGGGAVSDLHGFESYLLAANVAQFPLPILTGIGHERDDTVIDLVAHTRLKTPTAVAAFLIDTAEAELDTLEKLRDYIYNKVYDTATVSREDWDAVARRLQIATTQFGSRGRERLTRLSSRIDISANRHIAAQQARIRHLELRIPELAAINTGRQRQRLELLARSLRLASPEHIFALGYSITTLNGHIIHSPSEATEGDIIETHLAKGTLRSRVEKNAPKKGSGK